MADIGVLVGVGNHRDFRNAILPAGDGQADAVDGDGPLGNDVAREILRDFHAVEPAVAFGLEVRDSPSAIDVPENKMAAEFFSGSERLFKIHVRASFEV